MILTLTHHLFFELSKDKESFGVCSLMPPYRTLLLSLIALLFLILSSAAASENNNNPSARAAALVNSAPSAVLDKLPQA